MKQELPRQTIHLLLFALAFLLKWLTRWHLIALLFGLLIISLWLMPHWGLKRYLYRRQDKKYSAGAICYFGVLIFLFLFFPVYAATAGWAALALGDGVATLVGKKLNRWPLPWNQKKTWPGTIGFALATLVGCFLVIWWLEPALGLNRISRIALVVGISSSLAESLPIKINDNISSPLVAALLASLI